MKKIFLLLLFVSSINLFSQKTIETISSSVLKEDREISIGLPASYEKKSGKSYPLLVLLDGDYLFDPFQGALNYGAYWDDLPEVIIVGISQNKNNEREADCTVDEETNLPADKGAKFFDFISTELMPYIQKKYRIAPFKVIVGHDTTAGFLNFFLYKDQPIFNAYISLSPELPEGMEEQIPDRLMAINQPIFYYQSTADGDVKKMQTRIRDLDNAIKVLKKPTLNYKFDDFKGATHYSLVLHSIPNALYTIFATFQPISTSEFTEKIASLPSGYVDYLINKYDLLEKTLKIKMPIRINDFKAIEAAILKNKAYGEFSKLSDLAKKNYPKTMLSDFHLATMYEKMDDYRKAIKSYQNAFQKEEIGDLTKDMMLSKQEELMKK
ncbi:alpha/beta hydrolase [Flavobacterium psychrotolerans]|uniref:Histidine kinase n=1 Tax=Flavobacterium psychrotolerans TaxID=2169410 RepID=A0A2U1JK19_9FLAO|nr:alpha/beta hydrolase-fold protein [Flavobacterium psychrotolerans]PWA05228.1 histidine kinase [Flavobacterium psychrotolerans]